MKRWQTFSIIFALCVGCTDSHKDPATPEVKPIETPKVEAQLLEPAYRTEITENILNIYLGDKLAAKISGGKVISESRRFVAYTSGGSTELLGKDGSKIYSCDLYCLIKVTNTFASVQTGAGEGIIFDSHSEILFNSTTPEKTLFRISDRFASVSSRSSAMLFKVGSKSSIYNCSDVACNILVSDNFAAVIDEKSSTGSIIGSNGSTIYSFSVPGLVQISNNFAAVTFKDGANIYNSKRGHIFSASVPVRIKISDTEAIVYEDGISAMRYDQNGNPF